MERYVVVLFWILVLAVILLSTPTKCLGRSGDGKKEGFYTYNGYYKNYCSSCGHKTRFSCAKCVNCGYAINESGVGFCTPGDASGPYFTQDATYWEYGSPYMYYPQSHLFPVIKTRSAFPYNKHQINKPWKWTKET